MNAIAETGLALQFGTWIHGKLHFSNKVIAVNSVKDASDKWNTIRDTHGFSGGGFEMSKAPICRVVDTRTAEQVAFIGYDGRAWALNGSELCAS